MKIRPVILCGGAGTRLWTNSKNHQAKQFIDFGNWTLLEKTLLETMYDLPSIPEISKVVIDKSVIESSKKPLLIYDKNKSKANSKD